MRVLRTWSAEQPPLLLSLLLLLLLVVPASGCQDCATSADEDLEIQAYIEALKQRMLTQLGMQEALPNGTRRQLVPPSVNRTARSTREARWTPPPPLHTLALEAWTLPSHSPVAEGAGSPTDWLGSVALVYQLPPEVTVTSLVRAELLLSSRQTRQNIADPSYITVYKLVPDKSNYYLKPVTKITRLEKLKNGMVSVDVTTLVRHWLKHPEYNLGLRVRATDRSGMVESGQYVTTNEPGRQAPVLQTSLGNQPESRHHRRRERDLPGSRLCSDPDADQNCCLYPLTVDFHSFGWDWIIAPGSYQANFCRGQCPPVYLQKYPHTHNAQQAGGTSGPCCSPRRLDSLAMLYWNNENHVQLVTIPDMRVVTCGCH